MIVGQADFLIVLDDDPDTFPDIPEDVWPAEQVHFFTDFLELSKFIETSYETCTNAVFFIDLNLEGEGGGGLEALERMIGFGLDGPFFIVTRSGIESDRVASMSSGAARYVEKNRLIGDPAEWRKVAIDAVALKEQLRVRRMRETAQRAAGALVIADRVTHAYQKISGPIISMVAVARSRLGENADQEVLAALRSIEDNAVRAQADATQIKDSLSGSLAQEDIEIADLVNLFERVDKSLNFSPGVSYVVSTTRAVQVDVGKIEIIIENLLTNAIKYGSLDENIEVSVCDSPNRPNFIRISVRDFGEHYVSISEKGYIWEPFQRGMNAGTKPGSGLGLFTVRYFSQLHVCDSGDHGLADHVKADGDGNIFYFEVPAVRGNSSLIIP